MTDLAHLIVGAALTPGDWAIDATVGNGHDTAFLADCVGATGRVFGFDVQAQAIAATQNRLGSWPSVALLHHSHAEMALHLPPEGLGRIGAVMFNLGYLPGGDKTIITSAETTLSAIRLALGLLRIRGVVTIIVYPGHSGGRAEADAIREYVDQLDTKFAVSRHMRLGADRPVPELLVIERLR
jgi:hypothetical protein